MKSYIKAEYKYAPPKVGQLRTVNKFAWLPEKIITHQEKDAEGTELVNYYWIWLEIYKEDQVYESYKQISVYKMSYTKQKWFCIKKYQ